MTSEQTPRSINFVTGSILPTPASTHREPKTHPASAFGFPRDFLGNKYVYVVMSARAGGLTVGLNLNPNNECNFKCVYCEIDHGSQSVHGEVDVALATQELQKTLLLINSGEIRKRPYYSKLPKELLQLRHVALSGHGEPTLCPQFPEILEAVSHIRAQGRFSFYKIVVITNASNLDQENIQRSLKLLTTKDEIWAKLEAGSEDYMQRVNHADIPLSKVVSNIILTGKHHPVVIQSLFPLINEKEPSDLEILEYCGRLKEITAAGATISLVQIYSASRPMLGTNVGHLRLKTLSQIAKTVRVETGLRVELF